MKLIENAKTHTNKQFIEDVQKIHQDKNGMPLYDYSKTEYKGSKFPVKIICKKCNLEFTIRASHHKNGVGCKKCSNKRSAELRRSNTYEFIKKSKLIHKDKYDYNYVNYIDNTTSVKLKCNVCNFDFFQIPQSHLNGNGCPKCARRLHSKFMQKSQENFINDAKLVPQKRFDDCKNKIHLPFDFYLLDYNICIEFDGILHYQVRNSLGGFDRLINQKENDRIKTKYCHNKNIKLFRIRYTDNLKDSVQDILDYIKNNFKYEI